MNRLLGVTYRSSSLKPGDKFLCAFDGSVHEAHVLWTYYDHLSIEIGGKVRSISFEEADYPPFSIAARAVARTEAWTLYPSQTSRHASAREEYVEKHWIDHYPSVAAGYHRWLARQVVAIGGETETEARWVLSFDKHAGTEYQFRERREVSKLEDVLPLRREIERQASTANWSLTRERIVAQTYRWSEEAKTINDRHARDGGSGDSEEGCPA